MMIPAYNKKGCAAFHLRRESITGESPTSFPKENATMPYSGFEPEPTRLQPRVTSTILTGWHITSTKKHACFFVRFKINSPSIYLNLTCFNLIPFSIALRAVERIENDTTEQ
ncbi:hypothetical protein TNCV_1324691 [Trichonephila clavipes]|nr:hypothetical protein TNCV_1324691 [Trichonephila clavipes]